MNTTTHGPNPGSEIPSQQDLAADRAAALAADACFT